MKIAHLLVPLCFAACGDAATTGIYSESHGALRSPCEGSDIPLTRVARLTCGFNPPSPESSDRDTWRGAKPKSLSVQRGGVEVESAAYDYAKPREVPRAVYREDGNIERFTVDFVPNTVFMFTYEGGTLVGEHAVVNGQQQALTEIVYADGRRDYEGLIGQPSTRRQYRYDDSGNIVSRVGAGLAGKLPELPEASMFEGCSLRVPNIPLDAINSDMSAHYFLRDASGRITQALHGVTVGTAFAKTTYAYDGDKLLSITTECSESTEPTMGNGVRVYSY